MELASKELAQATDPLPGAGMDERQNNNSSGDSFLPRERQPEEGTLCIRVKQVIKNILSKYPSSHSASNTRSSSRC
jgi:hypothetical protein